MASSANVEDLLLALQDRVRKPPPDEPPPPGMTFRMPPKLRQAGADYLSLGREEAEAVDAIIAALDTDLRFEHLSHTKDTVTSFVAEAWADQAQNHVPAFMSRHERTLISQDCYLPIEHLTVGEETLLLGVRFLPLTAPEVPSTERLVLEPPIGCVAAVATVGTDYRMMADRGRELAAHALRVLRVGLREHHSLHDHQLRFRLGIGYAFDDQLTGWNLRSDVAYPAVIERASDVLGSTPVWGMPPEPITDVDKRADLALRWIERARLSGEPLIAILYLFFALEALLGDKSEGLKADGIAFRQMMLSHVVTDGFRHPNKTWFLYDQVRSAAVHGELAPDVDDATVRDFEWAVRDTLNEYLTFAQREKLTRRGRVLQALRAHPDVPKLVEWLRVNGGSDWDHYFETTVGEG